MRRIKTLLLFFLCAALCMPALLTAHTANAASASRYVRVGIAVPESAGTVSVASATCGSGFDIGHSSGESFSKAFTLSASRIAVIPAKNYEVTFHSHYAEGKASKTGNVGAYHVLISGDHDSYESALAAAAAYRDGFVAFDGSRYEARRGSWSSKAEAAAEGTATEPVSGGMMILDVSAHRIVLEYTGKKALALRGHDSSSVSLRKGSGAERSYPGFFEFNSASGIRIINVVELETYVKCVMANEIGTNQSRETRRAFSVLARTVPMESKHGSHGYDVCAESCCQVYLGNYQRDKENDELVDSTRGEYVTYKGEPIICLYHNSNGGTSCSSVAAWGGQEIPYLVSVTLEEDEDNRSATWQKVFSKEELTSYLHGKSAFSKLTGEITQVRIESTDPYGSDYVTLLSVSDSEGNVIRIENAMAIRSALKVQSGNFKLTYTMDAPLLCADGTVSAEAAEGYVDADGEYHAFSSFDETFAVAGSEETRTADTLTFDGAGTGHGVGFSSNGSEQLAAEGYSYKYILGFYFPGTEIEKLY